MQYLQAKEINIECQLESEKAENKTGWKDSCLIRDGRFKFLHIV